MPPGGAASDAPEHSCEHDGQNVSEVAEGCKEGHRQPVTAKPSLLSGRRLGEASRPTARRTNASGPVRSAKCVGTLRNLLGSATIAGVSGILARAQLAVFHQTRTADVAARRNDGRGATAARECLARTHALARISGHHALHRASSFPNFKRAARGSAVREPILPPLCRCADRRHEGEAGCRASPPWQADRLRA